MRVQLFFLAVLLFAFVVKAQWDDPDDPDDPDNDDPDDGWPHFANVTIYQPDDSTHHLTCPRTESLPNNTIFVVWNDVEQTNSTLQVYSSTNNGFSWYPHGTGSWSSETSVTLLVINAVNAKSTNIELYATWDQGMTWEFVRRIAEGRAVGSKDAGTPSMLFYDNHLTSTVDMWDTWDTAIDAVASNTTTDQMGTASAAEVALGEGQWRVIPTVAGRAYGREIRAVPNDKRALRITGGSEGKTDASDVLMTIIDLEKALAVAV
ncbi:hypothetical protein EK21DRAFT_103152 [Setomelanomma holmii]|uniref:Uncharacterized protein n=1 Tax=Setomelanomma holmii TaxID=210430 RepID=A0A9P4LJZ1_9PLEO|nr:hypothetical protein EK21DRAFT_103152 [Setomelanomma holmii]